MDTASNRPRFYVMNMFLTRHFIFFLFYLSFSIAIAQGNEQWISYKGRETPGKHIVLISGDEEYRSEEALPMLAKILSVNHGFKCTVLFSIDPETGYIDPEFRNNIPGLEALQTADLIIMSLRFRELSDDQMKFIDEYMAAGKPVVALRTSTHAFRYTKDPVSPLAKYSFDSKVRGWEGGYGRRVLGETWVSHHGHHGKEGTRGIINGLIQNHSILRGVRDIWCPTDVYTIRSITEDAQVLVYGQPTDGMSPDAPLNFSKAAMPVAWIKYHINAEGNTSRIFNTTMGAAVDFLSEDLRRLVVNACYWALDMDDMITEKSNVDFVGEFQPTMFGFGDHKKRMKPADFALEN